jgi:hypothetical protein
MSSASPSPPFPLSLDILNGSSTNLSRKQHVRFHGFGAPLERPNQSDGLVPSGWEQAHLSISLTFAGA